MGNFEQKVNKFIEIFIDQNGYAKVLEGLQNTLLIAVSGLIIGIIIGTIIAQIGTLVGGELGGYLKAISNVAKT